MFCLSFRRGGGRVGRFSLVSFCPDNYRPSRISGTYCPDSPPRIAATSWKPGAGGGGTSASYFDVSPEKLSVLITPLTIVGAIKIHDGGGEIRFRNQFRTRQIVTSG